MNPFATRKTLWHSIDAVAKRYSASSLANAYELLGRFSNEKWGTGIHAYVARQETTKVVKSKSRQHHVNIGHHEKIIGGYQHL